VVVEFSGFSNRDTKGDDDVVAKDKETHDARARTEGVCRRLKEEQQRPKEGETMTVDDGVVVLVGPSVGSRYRASISRPVTAKK
jgi:hypothetical protein